MFTKIYPENAALPGNPWTSAPLQHRKQARSLNSFLLRSRPGEVCPDAIPKRLFSSSLPPSFASGRFAASLYSPDGTAFA
jgi:hypothetical protein